MAIICKITGRKGNSDMCSRVVHGIHYDVCRQRKSFGAVVLLLQSFFDCGKAFFTDNMFHFACIFCCDFLWYTKTF